MPNSIRGCQLGTIAIPLYAALKRLARNYLGIMAVGFMCKSLIQQADGFVISPGLYAVAAAICFAGDKIGRR